MPTLTYSQASVQQTNQFNWSTSSRGSRHTLCASMSRGSHLIHPSQTVIAVASNNKSCFWVNFKSDIKSFSSHISINFIACIPLPEKNTGSMGLEDFLNNFLQQHYSLLFTSLLSALMLGLIITVKNHLDLVL